MHSHKRSEIIFGCRSNNPLEQRVENVIGSLLSRQPDFSSFCSVFRVSISYLELIVVPTLETQEGHPAFIRSSLQVVTVWRTGEMPQQSPVDGSSG